MQIVENRRRWFAISLIIILVGLIYIPVSGGLNKDIEFTGGTKLHINIKQEFNNSDIEEIVKDITGDDRARARRVTSLSGDKESFEVEIKTKELTTEEINLVFDALAEKYNLVKGSGEDGDLLGNENISATISSEMINNAFLAVLFAVVLMLIYITIRFRDFFYGVSAVIALVHDVLVVLAVYSLFKVPVNNSFIAAMLTIVGYSINDTIVLFDRIRENQRVMKRGDYEGLVNRSIKQTLSRSINTSLTTFIMVTVLYIIGVPAIKEFALPLMIGILSGTYSSIFIASPLWYLFKKKTDKTVSNA